MYTRGRCVCVRLSTLSISGGGLSPLQCVAVVRVVYICPYRAASYVLRLWARFSCPRFALFVPMIRPSCPRFAVFLPMRTAAVVVDCKRRRGGVPFGRSSFGAAARFSTRQSLHTSGRCFRVLSILSTLSIFGGVYGIASTRPPAPCGLTLSGCSFGAVSVPKKNAACLFGFGWWLRRSPPGAYSPAACIASTRRGGLCPKTAKNRLNIAEI